mmetsp:Transcript_46202/g.72305  ORF Transcript_46202/g.72305 Transcript_46202/m.72305 type:complete len:80 (+) Transcript_46202:738-977(+)
MYTNMCGISGEGHSTLQHQSSCFALARVWPGGYLPAARRDARIQNTPCHPGGECDDETQGKNHANNLWKKPHMENDRNG